jgi:nitrate/nitrite transporter NarK
VSNAFSFGPDSVLTKNSRKINIWACFIVLSPYLGPFVASLIIWKSTWPWAYWILTILWGFALILIVSFMDETYYDRTIPQDQQPVRKSRLLRIIGVEQWRSRHQRNTFFQAFKRPAVAITKIPVILGTLYYVFTFGWVIGLNAATGEFLVITYQFGPLPSGELFPHPALAFTKLINYSNVFLRPDGCHNPRRNSGSFRF